MINLVPFETFVPLFLWFSSHFIIIQRTNYVLISYLVLFIYKNGNCYNLSNLILPYFEKFLWSWSSVREMSNILILILINYLHFSLIHQHLFLVILFLLLPLFLLFAANLLLWVFFFYFGSILILHFRFNIPIGYYMDIMRVEFESTCLRLIYLGMRCYFKENSDEI